MLEASVAYQRESGSLPGRGDVLCCYILGAKRPVRATGPLRAWAAVQRKVAVCKDLRALLVQIIFKPRGLSEEKVLTLHPEAGKQWCQHHRPRTRSHPHPERGRIHWPLRCRGGATLGHPDIPEVCFCAEGNPIGKRKLLPQSKRERRHCGVCPVLCQGELDAT